MRVGIIKTSLGALGCAVALCALPIKADSTSYSIDNGNAAISGYAGPYATVDVNRTSATTATITFTGLVVAGNQYLLGGQGAVAFDVNASSWTLGALTAANSGTGFTPGPLSDGGSNTEDGFGTFNQTIDSFDGYSHSSDVITIMLTNTGGTWAAATDVLTGVAAHIFITTSPADASNGALVTGYATTGNGGSLPDGGSTVALLGLAMLGLGSLRRIITRA